MKYLFITSLFWSFNLFSQISLDPDKISQSAIDIINPDIEYVRGWFEIPYPNGDVDPMTGVCTDVVIRTYRSLGLGLQKEIHEVQLKLAI